MSKKNITITEPPVGIHAPGSAFEALKGLVVPLEKREKKRDVVNKNDIVKALKNKNSYWADFWGKADQLRFFFLRTT